jgi:hypothetical protein
MIETRLKWWFVLCNATCRLLEAQVPQQVRTRFLFLDSSFFPALAGSDNLGLVYDNLRKGRAAARTAYNRVKHFIEVSFFRR